MAKIDFEKIEKTKKKLVTQNVNMYISMKIKSFFKLLSIKNKRQTASLVVEIDIAKIQIC